jgi:hypothetical protein
MAKGKWNGGIMETVAMKKASMQKRRSEDAPPPETYKANIPVRLPFGVDYHIIYAALTTTERGDVLLEAARKAVDVCQSTLTE